MPANFSITPLALVEPVPHGSRGRNGTFTAASVQVHVHLPAGPGEGPAFCAIAAYSRRYADRAPAEITLSLGDAAELAETILAKVSRLLDLPTASETLARIREVLQDEDGEWRELNSCADAVQEISLLVDGYAPPDEPEEVPDVTPAP